MTKKFPLTNWSEKKAFTIKLGASVSSKKTRTNSTIWRSLFT